MLPLPRPIDLHGTYWPAHHARDKNSTERRGPRLPCRAYKDNSSAGPFSRVPRCRVEGMSPAARWRGHYLMYGNTAVACVVALLSAAGGGRACEDAAFRPLEQAKTSARWARDGFRMSVSGDPDKYIPHSMYIGKRCATRTKSRTFPVEFDGSRKRRGTYPLVSPFPHPQTRPGAFLFRHCYLRVLLPPVSVDVTCAA